MGYHSRKMLFFFLLGTLIASLILSCGMRMSVSLTGGSVHPEAKQLMSGFLSIMRPWSILPCRKSLPMQSKIVSEIRHL